MSARLAAKLLPTLEPEDLRVLLAVEVGTRNHEFVPQERVCFLSRLPEKAVSYRLERLHALKLINRWSGAYVGYAPTTAGFDCLALNALVRAEILEALGRALGVGKEADVYEALTPDGERVAVKFHRLGRTSFRQTRRLRGYTPTDVYVAWHWRSRAAAKREFEALSLAYARGVAVPRPIRRNRHVVVMGMIEGAELVEYRDLPEPEETLLRVLENLRRAYVDAGIIHADLSEFNVILEPDGEILIIDWPQYVDKSHPNAEQLLRRDVRNIVRFFRRRYGVSVDVDEALAYVKGLTSTLSI